MDYKNTNAPKNTITRDMNHLVEPVGNVYETVAIIAKRANQISNGLKKELDAKLQDFSVPQDSLEETFENKEQIEISRSYEKLPKPTLMATRIEYDGDYWHSLPEMVKRDHKKDEICQQRGIRLIRIKESDWLSNKDNIKQMLKELF